jgi:small multidrug resistance pump
MKGYIFLIATILIETISIIWMKMADGGNNKFYFTAALIAYFFTFLGLTATFKHLPMGWANAIWAGSSTVLVCLFGYYLFQEKMSWLQILFLSLIVIGLVGLNLTGKGK